MNVLGFEPYPDNEFCREWDVELTDLDSLLSRSDYVSLHNPLTPESHKMMNAERFAKMKAGSVFINTARGGLVDEPALIEALKSGHLRAAGLDVFDVEPLPTDSPLTQMNNVLLSGPCRRSGYRIPAGYADDGRRDDHRTAERRMAVPLHSESQERYRLVVDEVGCHRRRETAD